MRKKKSVNKTAVAGFLVLLAIAASVAIAQWQIERGKIENLPEQIASDAVAPGECLIVVKEHPERFTSSDPTRRGWIRVTEIIKDIEICNDQGVIRRSYHAHVIVCDKSPDLKVVQCTDYHAHELPPTTTTTTYP